MDKYTTLQCNPVSIGSSELPKQSSKNTNQNLSTSLHIETHKKYREIERI